MKAYTTENLRNLAVIGHGDAGKTQLVSSLLHIAGATARWGKVGEGTTLTAHDEEFPSTTISPISNTTTRKSI